YATAARLFREALTEQPGLADDLRAGHRYNAAWVAALAGCGQGKDAAQLTASDRAGWRRQALSWLDAEVRARRRQLQTGRAAEANQARQTLAHWRNDPDLEGVRDAAGLAKLAPEERQAWQRFWHQVDALLKPAPKQ